MLTAGSMVYCGLDGVCYVVGMVEKKVDGALNRYYELRPYYHKNEVIYLPENNEALLARLRPLIKREDIRQILADARKAECLWIEPEPLRRESFKAVLKSGDPLALLTLIRTLCQRRMDLMGCGKKLRTSDMAFLKDAERLLHEEFAYVLEIPPTEVPAYLEQQLGC